MNNKLKIVLNSMWILLCIPGFYLGFLTGLGMFLAGKKVNQKRWKTTGLIYITVLLVLEIVGFTVSDTVGVVYVLAYFVAVIHSVVILIKFIPKLSRQLNGENTMQVVDSVNVSHPVENASSFTVSKDLYSVNNSVAPEAIENISFDNDYYDNLNKSAGIIRTKTQQISDSQKKENNRININTCSEKELSSLPGISVVAAKKAISYRTEHNGFDSEDEFYKAAGIQLHFVKQIRDKIFCGENISEKSEIRVTDNDESQNAVNLEEKPVKERKGRVLDI